MGFQGLEFKQPRSGSSATPYTYPEARHAKNKNKIRIVLVSYPHDVILFGISQDNRIPRQRSIAVANNRRSYAGFFASGHGNQRDTYAHECKLHFGAIWTFQSITEFFELRLWKQIRFLATRQVRSRRDKGIFGRADGGLQRKETQRCQYAQGHAFER